MMKIYFRSTLMSLVFYTGIVQAQTITTIAGTGTAGYNGDNLAATVAQLYQPAGVTADNAGNVYIGDFKNNRIRKINPDGFISTIAGNGTQGYNGDNIPAVNAALYSPEAIALDQAGNLYFDDGNNNRIRKVSTGGIITTIAGTGTYGYNGDNIPAISAQVNYPTDGILVDGLGNVYFSDTYNHRIRKISTNGIISTIAGTGVAGYNGDNINATAAQLNFPYGLAFDVAGNLYVADGVNHRIRKISTTGIISTVAGTGVAGFSGDNIQATSSRLNDPIAVVVDAAGNIFIGDTYNNRIRKVNSNGIISTIAGNGTAAYNGDNITATLATLNYPNGLALDLVGNLLIADLGNHRIRRINNVGVILPLSLTKFTAQIQNGAGLLQWQTNNEINTQSFEIESSKDGVTYSSLGTVKANNTAGNHTYSFTDAVIKTGMTYYRLKMLDKDGKFTYSNIVSLKSAIANIGLTLYPSPAKNAATLSFISTNAGSYTVRIADISGKMIRQINGVALTGINKLTLDLHNYVTGTYILSITNSEMIKASLTFIKN